MAKKKKKINKMPFLIAAALAAFAAFSVWLAFYSATLKDYQPTVSVPENTTAQNFTEGTATPLKVYDGPMLETDIDNVLLSVHPSGIFTFYENVNGTLTPCDDTKTIEVTAQCSHQNIPATIYYLERDGKTSGYGLFTTSISSEDIRLFDYAFFRLIDMPSGYSDAKHLLMVDFDGKDFALNDKTYSELFAFDINSGKTTKITGDNGRTVDRYGRFRSDWAQLNDALIEFSADKFYLSGRNYLLDSAKADILFIEGNTKTKPTWKSSGIYENYMNTENGNLYYAKETEGGFEIFCMTADGTEKRISAYSGSIEDYLFFEDYIFNKNNLVLKRISTDENKADLGNLSKKIAYPEFMSVSKDGTKLVVLCNTAPQTAVLYDLKTGTQKIITAENLFTNTCQQIIWLSDNSVLTVHQKSLKEYETFTLQF